MAKGSGGGAGAGKGAGRGIHPELVVAMKTAKEELAVQDRRAATNRAAFGGSVTTATLVSSQADLGKALRMARGKDTHFFEVDGGSFGVVVASPAGVRPTVKDVRKALKGQAPRGIGLIRSSRSAVESVFE